MLKTNTFTCKAANNMMFLSMQNDKIHLFNDALLKKVTQHCFSRK